MLQITSQAAALLHRQRAEAGLPEHYGIRIYAEPSRNGTEPRLCFAFGEEPVAGDQVTEAKGTRVFISPHVAHRVDGMVIDAEESPKGAHLVLKI